MSTMKYGAKQYALRRLPDVPWHTVPVGTVLRFFAIHGEFGVALSEVDARRKAFGANREHGLTHPQGLGYAIRVRRQGAVCYISVPELVVGDIVLLQAGDRIPAHLRLIQVSGLQVDEYTQTGNAQYVRKTSHAGGSQLNMMHVGSVVVRGTGQGIVTALPHTTRVRESILQRRRQRQLLAHGLVVQNPEVLSRLSGVKVLVITATLSRTQQVELRSLCTRTRLQYVDMREANGPQVLRTITYFERQEKPALWASDGRSIKLSRNVASVCVALGGTDANKLSADFIALADPVTAIQGILYNTK